MNEQPVDPQAVLAARDRAYKATEFAYLRENGSYDIVTKSAVEQAVRDNAGKPGAVTVLDTRWVLTDEKARLVTREYATSLTSEFYAATGAPLGGRIAPHDCCEERLADRNLGRDTSLLTSA